MVVVERDTTTLPGGQTSSYSVSEETRIRLAESHAEKERLRKELVGVKKNLPPDKERLDIDELARGIAGLYEHVKSERMTESFEMDYYLFHPEIKSTQEFIQHVIKTEGTIYP